MLPFSNLTLLVWPQVKTLVRFKNPKVSFGDTVWLTPKNWLEAG